MYEINLTTSIALLPSNVSFRSWSHGILTLRTHHKSKCSASLVQNIGIYSHKSYYILVHPLELERRFQNYKSSA